MTTNTERAELIRLAKVALNECPATFAQDWQEAAIRVCRGVAALLEADAQPVALKPLTKPQIKRIMSQFDVADPSHALWELIVRDVEAAHGIKEQK